jgi:hypothetical protein
MKDEKQRVLAMRAPRYRGNGEKSESLAFMNNELADWVRHRKEVTDALVARYEQATHQTDHGLEWSELHRDMAELHDAVSRCLTSAATEQDGDRHRSACASLRADIQALRAREAATVPNLEGVERVEPR